MQDDKAWIAEALAEVRKLELPIDHEEAWQLAIHQRCTSNVARCYLDLLAKSVPSAERDNVAAEAATKLAHALGETPERLMETALCEIANLSPLLTVSTMEIATNALKAAAALRAESARSAIPHRSDAEKRNDDLNSLSGPGIRKA